eukprot:scaffold62073_cov60-Attheya_sp.AAC.2
MPDNHTVVYEQQQTNITLLPAYHNPIVSSSMKTKTDKDDNGYDEDDIKGNDNIQATSTEKNKKVS